jgi:transcriptional regulator with XRE-family HTH domain
VSDIDTPLPPGAVAFFGQLGPALRLVRERCGMTAAALARKAHMGKSQIWKYETGKEQPKLETLAKLLDALGVNPLWFFYLIHQLTRQPSEEVVRLDLLLLGQRQGFDTRELDGFRHVMESILELYRLSLEARIEVLKTGK